MVFNSLQFVVFLVIVFIGYWFVARTYKQQNLLLLIASYVFYSFWDWRFLSLIIISSVIDYTIGKAMANTEAKTRRKLLLFVSLFCNLGMLFTFKYFNFFLDSFIDFLSIFGLKGWETTLSILLPVGISFYTFQTLSYMAINNNFDEFKTLILRSIDGLVSGEQEKDLVFSDKAFNENGDVISHLRLPSKKVLKGRRKFESREWEGIERIATFTEKMNAKDIQVYFVYPTVERRQYLANQESFERLANDLEKESKINVLGEVDSFVFPTPNYFDSIYHLNKDGRKKRTLRFLHITKSIIQKDE